jgi:hypothetical protein
VTGVLLCADAARDSAGCRLRRGMPAKGGMPRAGIPPSRHGPLPSRADRGTRSSRLRRTRGSCGRSPPPAFPRSPASTSCGAYPERAPAGTERPPARPASRRAAFRRSAPPSIPSRCSFLRACVPRLGVTAGYRRRCDGSNPNGHTRWKFWNSRAALNTQTTATPSSVRTNPLPLPPLASAASSSCTSLRLRGKNVPALDCNAVGYSSDGWSTHNRPCTVEIRL